MKLILSLRLGVACALLASSAQGQSSRCATPFCLAAETIEALAIVHRAALMPRDTAQQTAQALASELMYVSKLHQGGLTEAIQRLSRFRQARDSSVRANSKDISESLSFLRRYYRTTDSVMRVRLDKAREPVKMGTQAEEDARMRIARRSAAQLLVLSVIGLTYSLTEPDSGGSRTRLALVPGERDALEESLRREFGVDLFVPDGSDRHKTDYAVAASVFYEFLKKPWPTRP